MRDSQMEVSFMSSGLQVDFAHAEIAARNPEKPSPDVQLDSGNPDLDFEISKDRFSPVPTFQ
jgi:hypothetical protein